MLDIQNQIDAGLSAANPLKKGLDLMSVWGNHFPLKHKINVSISLHWTINRDRFRDHLVVFST